MQKQLIPLLKKNGWISVEENLPVFDDGVVNIMLHNGKKKKARFNELGMWWRVITKEGVVRLEEEVAFWKK